MSKDKVQKKRVVTWETTDKRGNESAFATVDFRVPEPTTPPNSVAEEPK
jgi:hypothetical protein